MVPLANAIRFPRYSRFPFYCPHHQKTLLSPTDLVIRKPGATRTVKFGCQNAVESVVYVLTLSSAFVPPSLEDRTRLVLRSTMSSALLDSDKSGFIYALELYDPTRPDLVRIKVGRSKNVKIRLNQHRNRCLSLRYKILGSYPSGAGTLNAAPAPKYDRVERLVHIELADLSSNSYPLGRTAPPFQCRDCRSRHTEIFTFTRLKGNDRGREWSLIIRPVIERWARFVSLL